MCITSTARRRSLTLQLMPSHFLSSTAEAVPSSNDSACIEQPIVQHKPAPSPSMKEGLIIHHDYHDHATSPPLPVDASTIKRPAKGGVVTPFPVKLHLMLNLIEKDGLDHIVGWQPHGRAFIVRDIKRFTSDIMPEYFKQTKIASFQRQLNLYGFQRITTGRDKGAYYHEYFLKGENFLSFCYDMNRRRVKGTRIRLPTNPDEEPNFYLLPPVTETHLARSAPCSSNDDDLAFTFGKPFHYMDSATLPPLPPPPQPAAPARPFIGSTSSSVVSAESSATEFDWEAPLSSPEVQSAMRRDSFKTFNTASISDDDSSIDEFFNHLSMPVDEYHSIIDRLDEGDEQSFGHLIEQCIE